MDRYYRKAKITDLEQIMEAVEDSRGVLRLQGNGQWQDGYPNKDDFINDINNGRLFVTFDKDPNEIVGVCALTYREEDYHHLYEGKWLTELPYMVMHRVAIKKKYKGRGYGKKLFELFIEQAKVEGFRSLRIDTHEGNDVMRHLIESFGFIYCGKAILTPDKDRMVFERVLKDEEILRLEIPSEKYAKEYADANEEERLYSPDTEHIFEDNPNVSEYLEKFKNYRLGISLKPNHVPQTTMWLVDNEHFYGEVHLRHKLNDKLLLCGGTIGYGIRWSKRGLGYGKYMLKLGLEYCKDVLDIKKALITCNVENSASEGVMLANGATFGEIVNDPDDGRALKKYWVNINPHIIECDRFYLREYQESDYASLSAIYQDAENMKYFGAPYDDKMMRRLIDWTMNNYKKYGFGFWAIIDKKSGAFIGDCGLSMQNIDGEWLPEIGYHINLKYHNMGYASEAAKLVKEYIFNNYCYNSLYGYTTEDNVASVKVMIKNGMSFFKKFTKDNENYVVYKVDR